MYFGDIFGWNVVTRSLNAATNNLSVISSKINIYKNNYANYKPVVKKRSR